MRKTFSAPANGSTPRPAIVNTQTKPLRQISHGVSAVHQADALCQREWKAGWQEVMIHLRPQHRSVVLDVIFDLGPAKADFGGERSEILFHDLRAEDAAILMVGLPQPEAFFFDGASKIGIIVAGSHATEILRLVSQLTPDVSCELFVAVRMHGPYQGTATSPDGKVSSGWRGLDRCVLMPVRPAA